MFCCKCGNKLIENARFCTFCGAQVDASPNLAMNDMAKGNVAGYEQTQPNIRIVEGNMVVPPGYMDIGNPVKKPKVSAYTSIPHEWKMLSFSELFNGHKPDDMIRGRDGAYYWISTHVLYAMTEDQIIYRILSDEELEYTGYKDKRETAADMIMDIINIDVHVMSGAYTHDSFAPAESDNTQYTYLDYQHIKKIKPSPGRNAIQLAGMFGGTVCFPPQYFDFVYAYLSARI